MKLILVFFLVKLINCFKLSDYGYLLNKFNITKVIYIYNKTTNDQEFLTDLASLSNNRSNYYISTFTLNEKTNLSEDLRLGRNQANYDWNTNYCKLINEDFFDNDYVIFFFDYLELLIQVKVYFFD